MSNKNKKTFKQISYIFLSMSSIILSTEIQAMDLPDNDTSARRAISIKSKSSRSGTGGKYNLRGIALFSGEDLVSNMIKAVTGSPVSHVGLILSEADNENNWHCFESTGSAGEVLRGKYPHIQHHPWDEVVKGYEGTINYRLFVFDEDKQIESEKVTDFVNKYDNKLYTKNPLRLIKAALGMNEKSRSTCLKTAFCSELTAKMLMDLDIIDENIVGNFLPKHFSSNEKILLKKGVEITPEFKGK